MSEPRTTRNPLPTTVSASRFWGVSAQPGAPRCPPPGRGGRRGRALPQPNPGSVTTAARHGGNPAAGPSGGRGPASCQKPWPRCPPSPALLSSAAAFVLLPQAFVPCSGLILRLVFWERREKHEPADGGGALSLGARGRILLSPGGRGAGAPSGTGKSTAERSAVWVSNMLILGEIRAFKKVEQNKQLVFSNLTSAAT